MKTTNIENEKLFSKSIADGNIDKVKKLLKQGVRPNAPEYAHGSIEIRKSAVLHQAVGKGNLKIVEILVEAGANIDHLDFNKETPLFKASSIGNIEIAQYLINKKANINHLNHEHFSPLLVAIYNNDLEMISLLLDNNADVNPTPDFPGTTFVIALSTVNPENQEASFPILDQLKKANAEVNGLANTGWMPLVFAIANDLKTIAEYLLEECDADPNLLLNNALPMYEAAKLTNTNYMNLLLKYNGNPNAGEGFARPIFVAAQRGSVDMITTLLEAGAEVNTIAPNGQTPIMFALQNAPDVVKTLLVRGANVKLKDNEGKTVLDWVKIVDKDGNYSELFNKT